MALLKINKQEFSVEIEPETPLLWVLRDNLNLTGTKYGCGIGQCGACTVLMNGHPVKSCLTSVSQSEGYDIQTIEGLAGDALHPVQQAWIDEDVPQCGYCQSGQILAAVALLNDITSPTDEDIDKRMQNVCRCGTYPRIRRAIKRIVDERGAS
ncbi:MAG: (2Fe-2S)-binding protein [Proteobacteria bacterium]|nr:(2Fe-2S)-binding protein [Pseudomonadota bacterium]